MRCRGNWGEGWDGGCSTSGLPGPAPWERDLKESCVCLCTSIWEDGLEMKPVPETPSSAPDRFRIRQDSQERFCKSQGIWTELGDRPGHPLLDSLGWLGWVSLPVQVHTQNSAKRCVHTMHVYTHPFPYTEHTSTQALCTCLLMLKCEETPMHTDSTKPGSRIQTPEACVHTALGAV